MMSWFRKKPEAARTTSSSPSSLEIVETFLEKYDRSGNERSRYAMTLWGINEAFIEIFGGLDNYHSADASKRQRYLKILGGNAIKDAGEKRIISAECGHAFMNFLGATKGVSRDDLRGAIENFADRFDGIIRFGKSEADRVGKIENEVKETLASDAAFSIGSGIVKGGVTERNVIVVSQIIINDLQEILDSHQDYYFYIIEQYVKLRREPGIRTLLDNVPLFDVECELLNASAPRGEIQSPGVAYIESIRPSVRDWCRLTVPTLDPDELSLRVIGAAYGHFRTSGKPHFDEIRLGFARQYRERCRFPGQEANAARWTQVIERVGSR